MIGFRKRLTAILYLAAGLALLAGCGEQEGNETITIKFPHVVAPSTPKGQGAEMFREMVEERLGGRVEVEVYPSGQLMNDDDSLEALVLGEIEMIAVSLSKFDRLTTKFQLFDLPFLFEDLESVEMFLYSDKGRELLTTLEDHGFHGLNYWHNGMKHFSGPIPLDDPQDAAGLKFRIMESDVLQAQFRQIDANPQKMAFGEVYQALQTGAIDGQENTWSNMYANKFYEVQPYITETNHGYVGYFVAANAEFWRSLPDDVRTELEDILTMVSRSVNSNAARMNAEARAKIETSGKTEIVTLTPAQRSAWREAMTPIWDQFAGDIGRDLIEAAQSAAAPAASE